MNLNKNKTVIIALAVVCIGLLFYSIHQRNKRIDAEMSSDHLLKENETIKKKNEALKDSIIAIGNHIDTLSGSSLDDYWADFKKRHGLH